MDITFALAVAGTLSGLAGTGIALGTFLLYRRDIRSQAPNLTGFIRWGYFEESGQERDGMIPVRVYVEIMVDNKGRRGTSVKSVVLHAPSEGARVSSEGTLEGRIMPVSVDPDSSELLKMNFTFYLRKTAITTNTLMGTARALGFSDKELRLGGLLSHTHGKVDLAYIAYPKNSMESLISRQIDIIDAGRP